MPYKFETDRLILPGKAYDAGRLVESAGIATGIVFRNIELEDMTKLN